MLDLLYQDEHLVAVNKPAGMLVHRSGINPEATEVALQMLRGQIGQYVYPLHRIDKPTSGLLLFALDTETTAAMTAQFAERAIEKTYLTVVRGHTEASFTVDYPLKFIRDQKTDRAARVDKPAQEAMTHFRRLAQTELPHPVGRYDTCRYSLIEASPKTGRTHQIRRHLRHIFHPILGDQKYGDWRHNRFAEEQFGSRRMLLHAHTLRFSHPHIPSPVYIKAPPDEQFVSILTALGLPVPE